MVGKQIWPGWDTIEKIGSGGFSTVYKIKKATTYGDYFSALKVISIPKTQDEYRNYKADGYSDQDIYQIFNDQVNIFVKEVKLMSQFSGSANIVSYEDHMVVPKSNGFGYDIYIRMELLTTLTDYYSRVPFGEIDVIKLGADLCNALALCKQNNIIHRDIKPQNIFVNDRGDYKLGDFGIARVIEQATHATRIGTYSYMSPEIYRGGAYNSTADIYSLGLVLYWLLNERRLPFLPLPPAKPTKEQLADGPLRRLAGEPLPPPKYGSDKLKSIVLKATAFNPADRYQCAEDMCLELLELYNAMSYGTDGYGRDEGGDIYEPIPPYIPTDSPYEPYTYDYPEESNWRLISLVSLFSVLALSLLSLVIFLLINTNSSSSPPHNSPIIYDDSYYSNASDSYIPDHSDKPSTADKKLISLYVDSPPVKTTYWLGEEFDATGLVLKAVYSDGYVETIRRGFTLSIDTSVTGKQNVRISYKDKEVYVPVTVKDVAIIDFSIESLPKTSYRVGEALDTNGLTLKVKYSNNTEATVSKGFVCTPEKLTSVGRTQIYVKYAGIEKSFYVDVISEPTYVTTPFKTNYALGKTYTLARDTTDTDPNYLYLSYSDGVTKWADVELKKMTDGNVGDITNEAYGQSGCALENVTVQLVGTNKLFEYIIDLGENYGDISSFVFRNVRHGIPNGANRGFKLRLAYVSDDRVNWTKVSGNLSYSKVPGAPELKSNRDENVTNVEHFNFTYNLSEKAKGRYVRLCLISDGGYIIQLEEIEIWN